MKTLLLGLCVLGLAGCASAPQKEPLAQRIATPGKDVMPELECVSVMKGSPCRVTVRNRRAVARHIVWTVKFRTADGYEVRHQDNAIRELIVPAEGEAAIEFEMPAGEAMTVQLVVGDRP